MMENYNTSGPVRFKFARQSLTTRYKKYFTEETDKVPEKPPKLKYSNSSYSDPDLTKSKDRIRIKFSRVSLHSTFKRKETDATSRNPFKMFFSGDNQKPKLSWQKTAQKVRQRSRSSKYSGVDVSSSTTLNDVLQSSSTLIAFRDFLRSEHSQENLEFWLSVQEYKRETTRENAQELIDTFIKTNSRMEININHATRKKIELQLPSLQDNLFDEAVTSILALMENDSFKRFKQKVSHRKS